MPTPLRPKVYGSPGNRTHRRIIIHSDVDSDSEEESTQVDLARKSEKVPERSPERYAMADIPRKRSTKEHSVDGTTLASDQHHGHRRRRRRSSAVEDRVRTELNEEPRDRRESSTRDRSHAHNSSSAGRQDEPLKPRRRRRSSVAGDGSAIRRSQKEHRVTSRTSKRASTISLPAQVKSIPKPHRLKTVRTLRSETLGRAQSRTATNSRDKPPEYIVVEEIEDTESEVEIAAAAPRLSRRSSSANNRSSRPGLRRSATSARQSNRAAPLPTVQEDPLLPTRKPQRSASVFGNLFGPPRPVVPEAKVECLTCLDDIPASRTAKLACGHRMCNTCLKRIFTLSVSDPAHMPPKCCTEDHIPLKHVHKIFDDRFKMRWNRKYQEYMTKNRIYCPSKGCGTWIPPRDIAREKDSSRKYGTCRRCKTQVCAICNGKRHKSKDCPKDESTKQFAEMAKSNGWQRCYNCSATVELKEGCNHMTCRCTAQFCMICGSKWKTCQCPWFNYASVEADRLNHLNIAQVREEVARGGAVFGRPMRYQEELDQRREQERLDEELARRMQRADLGFGWPVWNVGNAADHHLNDNYIPQVPVPPVVDVPPQRQPPDRIASRTRPPRRAVDPFAFLTSEGTQPMPALDTPWLDRRPTQRTAAPAARSNNARAEAGRTAKITASEPAVAAEAANSRSAILAGLDRMSDSGRVNAWRRHVTGEPPISPL